MKTNSLLSKRRIATENAKSKALLYPEQFGSLQPPGRIAENTWVGAADSNENKGDDKASKGVLHLCGRGNISAPVLFVGLCVRPEDVDTSHRTLAAMLMGTSGNLFLRCLSRAGFKDEDWYFTSVVKYAPPEGKPKSADLRWGMPAFVDEIQRMGAQLKLIVCLGKPVLDFLLALNPDPKQRRVKYRLRDVMGAFVPAPWIGVGVRIFPMDSATVPVVRPEHYERFQLDLIAVKAELDALRGHTVVPVSQQYVTITKATELAGLMTRLKGEGVKELAVDAEWQGQTAWGGRLRSFQFCWAPGEAAYLRLMDDKLKYAFDRPIEVVRQILAPVFNDPAIKFLGHNASADMPWMHHHLDIDVYQRFAFDTMYAQHTVNEYADQKLERLAIRYTDLGRYDFDLTHWKNTHGFDDKTEEGYGKVPDEILIPYACKDVDTTFRCRVPLRYALEKQELTEYYNTFVLPFVTDGFYELMDTGLPINVEFLTDMRRVFRRNRRILFEEFRRTLTIEAQKQLMLSLARRDRVRGIAGFLGIQKLLHEAVDDQGHPNRNHPAVEQALKLAKPFFDYRTWPEFLNVFEHRLDAPVFNLNSTIQRKRWLFQVRKLMPVKTTKRAGVQIPWAKVLTLPKNIQSDYEPATDKDTVRVYAGKDSLVAQFQELRSVDTIVKSFLRGTDAEHADAVPNPDKPDTSEDENRGKAEQGLHAWIQDDSRIHANFSLTETARPRAWKPNILNWPKSVTKPIEAAFARVQAAYPEHSDEPASLRACVQAPPGWVIIDMDLKTAEIVALARYANDENMIRVLTEPDTQFARIDQDNPKKVVRIAFNENEGIAQSEWDSSLLVSSDDPRILRNLDGSIVHPKRDLHWEMGTAVVGKPREKCDERMVRDGCGKVGNFSIPYGASPSLLERLIEANTGIKPPAGTGRTMIATWEQRYPDCKRFLEEMEGVVELPGRWRSLSGRIRHFNLGDAELRIESLDEGVPHLLRQARNFPEQELVAATTGRALLRFIAERRRLQLRSRIGVLLYDAMTAFAPLEEARQTAELLRNCLTVWNQWDAPGGRFHFEVDVNFYFRWGVKLTVEERSLLNQHLTKP